MYFNSFSIVYFFFGQPLISFQVSFDFRLAFARSHPSHFCDQSTINQRSLLRPGWWNATCTKCSSSKTVTVGSAAYRCTDYSESEDWTMGENNFTYAFPSAGQIWTVRYIFFVCRDDLNCYFCVNKKWVNYDNSFSYSNL